jgi:hypothetical protein
VIAGGLVGLGVDHFGGSGAVSLGCGTAVALLAAPVGAVLGYDLSRAKPRAEGSHHQRLSLPTIGIGCARDGGSRVTPAVRINVVTLMF